MAPKKPLSTRPPAPSSSSEAEDETEDEQEVPQTLTQNNGTPIGKERESDTEEDNEENVEDDEEEEEEEEEEEDADENKKPAAKLTVSKSNGLNSDESDLESGTESGNSQRSPSPSDFEIASISSKHMDDYAEHKKDSMKHILNISPAVEANAETDTAGTESFFRSSALLSVLKAENITSDPEATSCLLRVALPLIDSAKVKEFDQKWKELQREQIQFFMKKTSLLLEGAKLVLGAMNSDKA